MKRSIVGLAALSVLVVSTNGDGAIITSAVSSSSASGYPEAPAEIVEGGMGVGAPAFIDKDPFGWYWSFVPWYLDGQDYVKLNYSDGNLGDWDFLLELEFSEPADVYIWIDDRVDLSTASVLWTPGMAWP